MQRGRRRLLDRNEIDLAKLACLAGPGVCRPDEVNERVGRGDLVAVRARVERIALHRYRARRELLPPLAAHERADGVPARKKRRNQRAADEAGRAGYEYPGYFPSPSRFATSV